MRRLNLSLRQLLLLGAMTLKIPAKLKPILPLKGNFNLWREAGDRSPLVILPIVFKVLPIRAEDSV